MANSYYVNNLVNGDTLAETDLEDIELGFDRVETDMLTKVKRAGTPVLNHIMTMDASGDALDSGCTASGGDATIPGTATIADAAVTDLVVAETVTYDAVVDIGNSSTAFNVAWTSGNMQKVAMTGNATATFSANPAGPCTLTLILTQDATGGRTITWPAGIKWVGGGTDFVLSTGANDIDIVTFIFDGTTYYGVGLPDFV